MDGGALCEYKGSFIPANKDRLYRTRLGSTCDCSEVSILTPQELLPQEEVCVIADIYVKSFEVTKRLTCKKSSAASRKP